MYPIDFVFRAARHYRDRVAIESPTNRLTYGEVSERVNSLATALQALDSNPTSRVGVCVGNTVEHIVALLAVLAAGKVWIPLNPRSSTMELARIIRFTAPTIVMATSECGARLRDADVSHWIALDDAFPTSTALLSQLIRRHAGRCPRRWEKSGEDTQAIKFTGGSTGVPKGVVQPVRAWRATVVNLIDAYGFDKGTRNLIAAPITHGAGTYILPVLAKGGTHVLPHETSALAVLDALEHQDVTTVFMPPTLLYMVLAEARGRHISLPGLKHLIYGGGPMPVNKIREAQDFFGPIVGVTYGQTEAPQIVAYLQGTEMLPDENVGSVGRAALLSDFAIMGSDGQLLNSGEIGEIVVRGEMIMSCYLGQPEKTAETIVDGWLHTGDLGLLDERGFLFLRGRSREVIITGGFNVYPVDVEEVLAGHPKVEYCAVFGIPDEKWGEAVHASVQLRPGTELDSEELVQFAKQQMGSVKAPKRIDFCKELPRNSVGKIDKEELKRRMAAGSAISL